MHFFLYLILFLVNIKLKKYVIELFLKILFFIVYCPDKYKTQEMCDEAADDSLAALRLIPDWFVRSKMIKNSLLLCMQMKIFFILIKILVMLYLIVTKRVFLILILIILMLIMILIKMILYYYSYQTFGLAY